VKTCPLFVPLEFWHSAASDVFAQHSPSTLGLQRLWPRPLQRGTLLHFEERRGFAPCGAARADEPCPWRASSFQRDGRCPARGRPPTHAPKRPHRPEGAPPRNLRDAPGLRVPPSVLDRLDLDVPKLDFPAAGVVLKADHPGGVLGIAAVEDLLAVQHNDEVVPIRGDVVAVPLIGQDLGRFGFEGIHQRSGLESRPKVPDLQFITGLGGDAAFFLGAQKDAAVDLGAGPEIDLQVEVGVSVGRAEPSPAVPGTEDRAIGDAPGCRRLLCRGLMRLSAVEGGAVEQESPAGRGFSRRKRVRLILCAGRSQYHSQQDHAGKEAEHSSGFHNTSFWLLPA